MKGVSKIVRELKARNSFLYEIKKEKNDNKIRYFVSWGDFDNMCEVFGETRET